MKRLLLFTLFLTASSFLTAQAEMDLDERSPHPALQQQTERIREELRGQPQQKPAPQRQKQPRPAPSGYAWDQKAESDTDNRVPQPAWLQQRDRILAELSENPMEPAITAEVRTRWRNQYKRNDGHMTRGVHAVVPVSVPTAAVSTVEGASMTASANRYITELNLFVDYETCRNWMEAKLSFKNDMGIESGTDNKISLQKAWIGYDAFDDNWGDLDLEIGRKPCSEIFDSRIEFDSTFDGALVTWRRRWKRTGEIFIHGGPEIIDARTTQFAFIGEMGIEEAFDTGAYTKISLAWWRHRGADRYNVKNSPRYRYINPQLLVGYDFCKEWLGFPSAVYAAGLYNCAAKPNISSAGKKRAFAWYAAIEFGKLKKAGDFFFDVCYQDVGSQAVPNFDMSGIGRGNSTSWGDLPVIADPTNPGNYSPNTAVDNVPAAQVQGNNNFRGVEVRFYYNFTDQLTLRATADVSAQKTRAVGGGNTYRSGELQLIYGF